MNHKDRDLILTLRKNHHELDKLYSEHQKLEQELDVLSRKKYLAPPDQQRERELKTRKLKSRDRLSELVSQLEAA